MDTLSYQIQYRCTGEEASEPTRPVIGEEIKMVLFSMASSKAHGPNGYTV